VINAAGLARQIERERARQSTPATGKLLAPETLRNEILAAVATL